MANQEREDVEEVTFETTVASTGISLTLKADGYADYTLGANDQVKVITFKPTRLGSNTIKVMVRDDGAYQMAVSSSGDTWTSYPVGGSRLGVECNMGIPAMDNTEVVHDLTIVTVVGGQTKTRQQRVIIRHKPG